ncbi:hypothetical protein [Dactylosporangium sp. NPDC051484]|uniref:hypothetical protein n=1 Tax=Dactylosporangium sp. NPDC051484 TaxID=3154942 RepID=UPI00344E7578
MTDDQVNGQLCALADQAERHPGSSDRTIAASGQVFSERLTSPWSVDRLPGNGANQRDHDRYESLDDGDRQAENTRNQGNDDSQVDLRTPRRIP